MYRPVHFPHRPLYLKVGIAVALVLTLGISSSRAELFTASGTGGDGSLAASADFEFSQGQLTIILTNTLAANVIRSQGQALSDISFTLSNAPGTLTSATASGQFGNVNGSGQVTYETSDSRNGDTTPLRWLGEGGSPPHGSGTFTISGNTITLEALGGGKPSQMIIPSIANGGTYTNVENGFQQMNSYVIGPATFTLKLPGITPNTIVESKSVEFSFGTGPDTVLSGSGGPSPAITTPAPPSVVLLGFGGLGLAVVLIHSRRQLAIAA